MWTNNIGFYIIYAIKTKERGMERMKINAESLVVVHTHTHR